MARIHAIGLRNFIFASSPPSSYLCLGTLSLPVLLLPARSHLQLGRNCGSVVEAFMQRKPRPSPGTAVHLWARLSWLEHLERITPSFALPCSEPEPPAGTFSNNISHREYM